jgi:very-short-patch-repair endonuclease
VTVKLPEELSEGEETLARDLTLLVQGHMLPQFEREYRFHPERKWRADFAWPEHKLLVEVEGKTYARGRHNRGEGYHRDLEKYNNMTLMLFWLLRFDTPMATDGTAVNTILEWFSTRGT